MCFECGTKEVNPFEGEHKIIGLKGDHSHNGLARRYSSIVIPNQNHIRIVMNPIMPIPLESPSPNIRINIEKKNINK